jgi:hypothetical protein
VVTGKYPDTTRQEHPSPTHFRTSHWVLAPIGTKFTGVAMMMAIAEPPVVPNPPGPTPRVLGGAPPRFGNLGQFDAASGLKLAKV